MFQVNMFWKEENCICYIENRYRDVWEMLIIQSCSFISEMCQNYDAARKFQSARKKTIGSDGDGVKCWIYANF